MKKLLTRITLVVVLGLLALQLVLADRTNPPVKTEIAAPDGVGALLERSCYDCHSNRTRWPWYSRVAPVSWYVVRHVNRGRDDLNLTEWPLLDFESQQVFLGEMKDQVKNRKMPLESYLLLHRSARLSDDERTRLLTWIDGELSLLRGSF